MREYKKLEIFFIGIGLTLLLSMTFGFIGMVAAGIITGYLTRKGADSIFIGYFVGFTASILSVLIRFAIDPNFLANLLSQGDPATLSVSIMGVGFFGGIILAFVGYFGALFYKYGQSNKPVEKTIETETQ